MGARFPRPALVEASELSFTSPSRTWLRLEMKLSDLFEVFIANIVGKRLVLVMLF